MINLTRILRTLLGGIFRFLSVWLIFASVLWASQGALKGIPALLAAVLLAGFWWRRSVHHRARRLGRSLPPHGRVLRALPGILTCVPLILILLPAASSQLTPLPGASEVELWTTGPGRAVAVYRLRPPPGIPSRKQTLLFVHGGPGGYVRNFDRDFFASFTDLGFEVVLYDQFGSGRSPIGAPSDYTHSLSVRDLSAVLERINQPTILIAQSYGAALATSALADPKVQAHISHVILTEPGKLPGSTLSMTREMNEKTTTAADAGQKPTPAVLAAMLHPRTLAASFLPGGAHLVPQEELINLYTLEVQQALIAGSYCKGQDQQLAQFQALHFNPLANILLTRSSLAQPRPAPLQLRAPVMLLLGACSYVPRGRALAYFDILPISNSYWIDGVGHILWGTPEGQRKVRDAIVHFIDQHPIDLPAGPHAETRAAFLRSGR